MNDLDVSDLASMLNYAKRVAFRMSKDPEVESLAAFAAWRAQRTYDPTRNVPVRRWVARCVKHSVWGYWRQLQCRPSEQKTEMWWAEMYTVHRQGHGRHLSGGEWQDVPTKGAEAEAEAEAIAIVCRINDADWSLLYEHYVDKWPLDVSARRRETTVYRIKQQLSAAVERLRLVAGA